MIHCWPFGVNGESSIIMKTRELSDVSCVQSICER